MTTRMILKPILSKIEPEGEGFVWTVVFNFAVFGSSIYLNINGINGKGLYDEDFLLNSLICSIYFLLALA